MKKLYALTFLLVTSLPAHSQSQCYISFSTTSCSCYGICDGTATANVQGGMPPYTYQWSNGQTAQTATGLCAGTYSCMVVDVMGMNCSASSPAIVTQPAILTVTASTAIPASCNGCCDGNVVASINGGTPPCVYVWTPSFTPGTACGGTSYTVCVTDANGCTACDTVIAGYTVGYGENGILSGNMAYPNPAHDELHLLIHDDCRMYILNAMGDILVSRELGTGGHLIDVSLLPAGLYLLYLSNGAGHHTKTIIKQ
ncbi:MAG: T9SS type A sorting domain-containing protein [Bacteroidota bacterium]